MAYKPRLEEVEAALKERSGERMLTFLRRQFWTARKSEKDGLVRKNWEIW